MALTPAAGFHPAAAPSVSRWTRESNLATAIVGLGRVRRSNWATAIGGPRRARRGLRQVLNGSYACRGIPSRGGSGRIAVDAGIQHRLDVGKLASTAIRSEPPRDGIPRQPSERVNTALE